MSFGDATPIYTPHVDAGDVIVINADKVKVTGRKGSQKKYCLLRYPGGLRERTFDEQVERNAAFVIENAVKGMLPKNRLARKQLKKLRSTTVFCPSTPTPRRARAARARRSPANVPTFYGTGRRKAATARVYLRPGNGRFVVNKCDLDDYFRRETDKMILKQPLQLVDQLDSFDITVTSVVATGQAGAINGISRALLQFNGTCAASSRRLVS